jgi:outer membrane protein OmpA-like peptidoglycan-associated protein
MRRALVVTILGLAAIALLLMPVASYANEPFKDYKDSYFGVSNKAAAVPSEFDQTEAAIAKAEKSAGAKMCADKLAQAKALAKKGVETYWSCRTAEGLAMLADARKLAQEVEACKPAGPKEVIVLTGVNFAFNSAELTPQSKAILDNQVAKLKANKGAKVQVAGHCDIVGSDAYNQKLSEKRAQSVMNYFISQGIDGNLMTVVGYGKFKPIAPNDTEEGRAKNRRVELHIF